MLVTSENLPDSMQAVKDSHRVVLDLETTGLKPYADDLLCGVALLTCEGSLYFPFRHSEGNLPLGVLKSLLKLLRTKTLTTWNGKFDLTFLLKDGFDDSRSLVEDVMLAAHLCDENAPDFKLKNTASRLIDPEAAEEEKKLTALLKTQGKGKGSMSQLPAHLVSSYAERDVELTELLRRHFLQALDRDGLYPLWQDLNGYLKVVQRMEQTGIKLDLDELAKRKREAVDSVDKLYSDLEDLLGRKINANSVPQVAALLRQIGVDAPNTRVETLESIDHPAVAMVVAIRQWTKVSSSYYDAFLEYADRDGVLHPNFNQIGTVTGRFSCSEPNLQAIPRKDEGDQPKSGVKSVFVAREGYTLLQADYKQAEVYLGAAYAQAKYALGLLASNADLHGEVAKAMGIPRPVAKRLNFSMQYGIGAKALAQNLKVMLGIEVSETQAASHLKRYNELYPEFKRLYHVAASRAEKNGSIRLFTGRKRRYNNLPFSMASGKASPAHKASSNLIQGGVAEVMRIASTNLHRELASEGVRQLLHVHDSILFEIPKGKEKKLTDAIRDIMTDPVSLNVCTEYGPPQAVPFRVDISTGDRWSSL